MLMLALMRRWAFASLASGTIGTYTMNYMGDLSPMHTLGFPARLVL